MLKVPPSFNSLVILILIRERSNALRSTRRYFDIFRSFYKLNQIAHILTISQEMLLNRIEGIVVSQTKLILIVY